MQDFLESTNFTSIFIGLVVLKFLLETYLKVRNLKSIELNKNAIPERFVGVVTEEEYKKSIVYNIDRIRFQIFTALFGAVVLIIFTLGGLFNFLAEIVVSTTSSDVLGAVLLGLLLLIVEQVISIPISIYSTFVIEERHGFNKTTTKTFVTDMFKSLLISATISSIIYATVIYIVIYFSSEVIHFVMFLCINCIFYESVTISFVNIFYFLNFLGLRKSIGNE